MFRLKQYLKMLLQNVFLPYIYRRSSRRPVQPGLVLFADGHHNTLPFAMARMEEAVSRKSSTYTAEHWITDFASLSFLQTVFWLIRFMKRYAVAEYVFVCDYFLPVASCRKRSQTKVVQLWHSCGLMKKIAHDAKDDIPKGYHGSLFENYTYLTLSAEICIPVHERALQLPRERIFATGVSRTDFYFDPGFHARCWELFSRQYADAVGKKIALWAPTFRGNAARPYLVGLEEVRQVARELGEDWLVLIKGHPHLDAHQRVSNCAISSEELLPVVDLLITDYSSILFDYLLFDKPAVLFAPDLKEYEEKRGFYLDYRSIPYPIAETKEELLAAVAASGTWMAEHAKEVQDFKETYVGACDGHATERILELIGLRNEG